MSLVSISFLLFFLCLLVVYYIVPARFQVYVLVISNIVFYCWAGLKNLPFLIIVCVFSFSMGLLIDWRKRHTSTILSGIEDKQLKKSMRKREEKKLQALTGLIVAILVAGWCAFKILSSSLPLGLSFYVFIAISYIVDIYRDKYEPSRNIVKYSAFMCFFPHLTQGPFSRYDVLGTRIFAEHKFNGENIKNGILLIIWGLIKKTVIATRISKLTGTIMANDGSSYSGVFFLILMIWLVIELYADFSGYMDIVSGISKMLGIELQQNFKQPIFAKSIEEIWHRWHITLGEWFKDYVFYPISISPVVQNISKWTKTKFSVKVGRAIPIYISLVLVWTSTGLWHGLAFKYLAWGWLNLIFIAGSILLSDTYKKILNALRIKNDNKFFNLFRMIRTFLIFGLMEMVSSAPSLRTALRWATSIITGNGHINAEYAISWFPGLDWFDVAIVAIGVVVILVADIIHEKGISFIGVINKWNIVPRYIFYCFCVFIVIVLGDIGGEVSFMYAQF